LLLEKPQRKLDNLFNTIKAAVTRSMDEIRAEMGVEVDKLLEDLQSSAAESAFQNSLRDHKPQLLRFSSIVEGELKMFLTQVYGRLSEHNNGDIFVSAMKEPYDAASKAKKMSGKRPVNDLSTGHTGAKAM
jgi:hypothetical protein